MTGRSSSRRLVKLRDEFYAEGAALDRNPDTRADSVCWLCGQRIDYDATPNSTPDSHNLDHYHPWSKRPDLREDPTNFRHAHALCNTARGNRAPTPALENTTEDWW